MCCDRARFRFYELGAIFDTSFRDWCIIITYANYGNNGRIKIDQPIQSIIVEARSRIIIYENRLTGDRGIFPFFVFNIVDDTDWIIRKNDEKATAEITALNAFRRASERPVNWSDSATLLPKIKINT